MGLENLKCFDCEEYGHLAKDCPHKTFAAELGDGKPPWCGREICDRETRLTYTQTADGLKAQRCVVCHPQSHSLPVQFGKCRKCKGVVYSWDSRSQCGQHQPVGKQLVVQKREYIRHENQLWKAGKT
jgi:hypothetical protein